MFIFCCSSIRRRIPVTLAAVFLAVVFLTSGAVLADDPPPDQGRPGVEQKLRITSDSLFTDNEAKYADFIGHVKAAQGRNTITSDKLRIYFKAGTNAATNPVAHEDSIQKLVATGNVIIHFDDKVAVAQKAEYLTDTRILILTGANSKITRGKDSISGEKITLYRADGRIDVESGTQKQVEALFFSGQKGLQ